MKWHFGSGLACEGPSRGCGSVGLERVALHVATQCPTDERVVSLIERYLDEPAYLDRAWVLSGTQLLQRVLVTVDQWHQIVSGLDPHSETAEGVAEALSRIKIRGGVIDRELLTELSRRVNNSPWDRVACWFATMCWGAGPHPGFRLRQWTPALSLDVASELVTSSSLIAQGQLAAAYRSVRLPELGEAYLTKWLLL